MATYAFSVEAKLPQKIEPAATKPVNYETKTLTNGAKVIARNAWSEVRPVIARLLTEKPLRAFQLASPLTVAANTNLRRKRVLLTFSQLLDFRVPKSAVA
jgi:hypothetical protein